MIPKILNQPLYQKFKLHLLKESWTKFFQKQAQEKYFNQLLSQIDSEYQDSWCCPSQEQIFRLFWEVDLSEIKVVILGQDPYHQPKVADGIAFSSQKPHYLPPTLKNIFQEMSSDLGSSLPTKGNLLPWIKEGVFLLNTALTVKASKPLSHTELWTEFTYHLINYLNGCNSQLVWIFWGARAKKIKEDCQIKDEFSLVSFHPSPFSAKYGFFGSKPFSKTNNLLTKLGKKPINWLVLAKNLA